MSGILIKNVKTLQKDGNILPQQSIFISQDKIAWTGFFKELPPKYSYSNIEVLDGKDNLVTPGLIDCHTHLVHGGNRSHEFRLRQSGMSYEDIARRGGGICSTVDATRKASEEELMQVSLPRLQNLLAEGVTTVEIKSGYGLNLETELKMLQVARKLGETTGQRIVTTFLGAHAVPVEYQGRSQDYVDYVCKEILPAVAESKLADAVDVFCESIAFNLKQCEQVFKVAQEFGLPIKCHAEQLSNMGCTSLASSMGAISCDHLEYLSSKDIDVMQKSKTVAVLLPGAFYYLGETKKPPVAMLREKNIPMAIASDLNPGSSPTSSLLLMLSMACQFFKLTVEEALQGVTINAAKALKLSDSVGSISQGMVADLVLWSVAQPEELCYYFGGNIAHRTMIKGRWLS